MKLEDSRTGLERRFNRKFWTGFVSGLFALAVVGGLLAFLLSPEILKHRSPAPGEEAIGGLTISRAIDGSYKDKDNPVALNDANVANARAVYIANCSVCHGASGKGDAPVGRNLFPPAANLLDSKIAEMSDGELFWIVENGLAFVGMPSFKNILNEQDRWKAITYVRALQKGITPQVTPAATTAAATSAPVTTAATPAVVTTAASNTTVVASNTTAVAGASNTASGDDLARGLAVFRAQGCTGCHGGDLATGGIGPKIAGIEFPEEGLLRQVRSGSGVMPAFPASQLPDSDVMLIYAYLRSLK